MAYIVYNMGTHDFPGYIQACSPWVYIRIYIRKTTQQVNLPIGWDESSSTHFDNDNNNTKYCSASFIAKYITLQYMYQILNVVLKVPALRHS